MKVELERYHVPDRISNLILDYYNTLKMITISKGSISSWHNLERDTIAGCTISAKNLLKYRGPVTRSALRQPPIRAYINMTITTTSTIGARWVLESIEKLITWARMSFNASKSRSLVLKKGIDGWKSVLNYRRKIIPTIQEKSIKSLGKHIDYSLRDTVAIQETLRNGWLKLINPVY